MGADVLCAGLQKRMTEDPTPVFGAGESILGTSKVLSLIAGSAAQGVRNSGDDQWGIQSSGDVSAATVPNVAA